MSNLLLTRSWVESITLSIVEKSELLDTLKQHVSLPLRGEVVLFQLLSQLFVVHHVKHKLRETLQTRGGGGGRGERGVATGSTGSGCGYLIEAFVEVSVDELLEDFYSTNRAGN